MDSRMWQALGNCYERLGKNDEAILTYRRALSLSEVQDSSILLRLALIEEKSGNKEHAAIYMRRCLFGLGGGVGVGTGIGTGAGGREREKEEYEEEGEGEEEQDNDDYDEREGEKRQKIGRSSLLSPEETGDEESMRSGGDPDASMTGRDGGQGESGGGAAAAAGMEAAMEAEEGIATAAAAAVSTSVGEGDYIDEKNHARLWLARYEMSRENWKLANEYARGIIHGSPNEMEEARAIVRDTNSRLAQAFMMGNNNNNNSTGKHKKNEGNLLFRKGERSSSRYDHNHNQDQGQDQDHEYNHPSSYSST